MKHPFWHSRRLICAIWGCLCLWPTRSKYGTLLGIPHPLLFCRTRIAGRIFNLRVTEGFRRMERGPGEWPFWLACGLRSGTQGVLQVQWWTSPRLIFYLPSLLYWATILNYHNLYRAKITTCLNFFSFLLYLLCLLILLPNFYLFLLPHFCFFLFLPIFLLLFPHLLILLVGEHD